MDKVKAKKSLGQHFLKDLNIAKRIAESVNISSVDEVLEIGPGMGVLTQYLLELPYPKISAIEIDTESVAYLQHHFKQEKFRLLEGDFLKMDLNILFPNSFALAGNFPYNISSQIMFKVLDYRDKIPQVVGMFQKEVAERFAAKPGGKEYGILSVLIQAFYDVEYLFTVHEHVFSPPPKVKSGVIRVTRKDNIGLDCDENLFKDVVKTAFNQRRKTLRNSLKKFNIPDEAIEQTEFAKLRPEVLSVADFVKLTLLVEEHDRKQSR